MGMKSACGGLRLLALVLPILLLTPAAWAATPATGAAAQGLLFGDWLTPLGSVVRIGSCPNGVCLWIAELSSTAAATTDIDNPNPALRSRQLCGLKVGSGFHLDNTKQASGGTLYDPETGKTYHGVMTVEKEVKGAVENTALRLRGYVGIPLFGRTETWRRYTGHVSSCLRQVVGAERSSR